MLVIMTRFLLVIDVQESFRQGAAVAGHLQIPASPATWPASSTARGQRRPRVWVLPKSHISPGNLNRRLRIEAMYFL